MRIKVVLPMLLVAGFFLLVVAWLRPRPENPITQSVNLPAAPPAAARTVVRPAATPESAARPATAVPPADISENPGTAAASAAPADGRMAELEALAMNNDTDSLDNILRSLTDPDRRIRDAALAATIQFDSPDAIPTLQAALAQTDDPQEKVNLQRAIGFLMLKPLTQADSNDQP